MLIKRKKFNPKLSTLKLMSKIKFSGLKPGERIAYANLGTTKVSDLVLACDLDLSVHQILDYADNYKKQGKTYLAKFGNRGVTIMTPGSGPSSWEMGLMGLISAGAKKIIQVGVCGTLTDKIKIGDLIVADSVVINDEVSKAHTNKKMIKCQNEMYDFLKKEKDKIVSKDVPLHFVKMVSASTLFGQTKEMLKKWSKLGDGIDLETGILFAMCKKYGVECIGIYAVVDDKLRDLDIFTMDKFPMDKIFDNSDYLIRALITGIKDYNLVQSPHGNEDQKN